jgi:ankyrin repeat protein
MDDPEKPKSNGLGEAIDAQDLAAVQRLLSAGASANTIYLPPERNGWDEERHPVLVYAARLSNVDIVRALLDAGADLQAQWELDAYHWPDGYENTEQLGDALCVAASAGRVEIVELLLQRGASSRAEALVAAANAGQLHTTRLILEHGEDPGTSTNRPLYSAVRNDHLEVVKLLVEHGALVNRPQPDDGEYGPPYEAAVALGRTEIAEFLRSKGAKPRKPGRRKPGRRKPGRRKR